MKPLLLGLLLAFTLSGCIAKKTEVIDKTPSTSMYVVEHGEIVGRLPGPNVYVRFVADFQRDLCFVLFQDYDSMAAVKVACASLKPNAEVNR